MVLLVGSVYASHTKALALQLVDNKAHSRFGIYTRSHSLYQVITLLSDLGVRRVVVVEAGSQRLLGLITLRDVFSLIFRDLC
ncbi:putative CBS domain-containing protein [Helianthus anomalus]